tara:strand:- start:244 stop:459 length:216 start_codon:yes stop_codon:yes gene_type:complete
MVILVGLHPVVVVVVVVNLVDLDLLHKVGGQVVVVQVLLFQMHRHTLEAGVEVLDGIIMFHHSLVVMVVPV